MRVRRGTWTPARAPAARPGSRAAPGRSRVIRDAGVELVGGPLGLAYEVLLAQRVQGVADAGALHADLVSDLGVGRVDLALLAPADHVRQDGGLQLADDVVHQAVRQDAAQEVVADEGVAVGSQQVVGWPAVDDGLDLVDGPFAELFCDQPGEVGPVVRTYRPYGAGLLGWWPCAAPAQRPCRFSHEDDPFTYRCCAARRRACTAKLAASRMFRAGELLTNASLCRPLPTSARGWWPGGELVPAGGDRRQAQDRRRAARRRCSAASRLVLRRTRSPKASGAPAAAAASVQVVPSPSA